MRFQRREQMTRERSTTLEPLINTLNRQQCQLFLFICGLSEAGNTATAVFIYCDSAARGGTRQNQELVSKHHNQLIPPYLPYM